MVDAYVQYLHCLLPAKQTHHIWYITLYVISTDRVMLTLQYIRNVYRQTLKHQEKKTATISILYTLSLKGAREREMKYDRGRNFALSIGQLQQRATLRPLP